MTIDPRNGTVFPLLQVNPNTNYGWKANDWDCNIAFALLDIKYTKGGTCYVELSTEDKYWFSVAVIPNNLPKIPGNLAMKKVLKAMSVAGAAGPASPANRLKGLKQEAPSMDLQRILGDLTAASKPNATPAQLQAAGKAKQDLGAAVKSNPLIPGFHINANLPQDEIVEAMVNLHRVYQKNNTQRKERNSCLKNARALNWLDLQAHFYCILPYNGIRSGYSTTLVKMTETINPKAPKEFQLAMLLNAFWKSYNGSVMGNLKGENPELSHRVFQFIMFTKRGAMDFNLEDEHEVIEKFYAKIEAEKLPNLGRERRTIDSVPTHHDQQARYETDRNIQFSVINGKRKEKCLKEGKTWNDANALSPTCE